MNQDYPVMIGPGEAAAWNALTRRQQAHKERKAALPELVPVPRTVAPNVAARRSRDAAAAEAHRERTKQGPHVHVEARVWATLGEGWGGAPVRTERSRLTEAKRARARARNLATLPQSIAPQPKRAHDPRQRTPKKVAATNR